MQGCGHSKYRKYCSEDCQLIAHEQAHEDPLDWVGECKICDVLVEEMEATMIGADIDHSEHPISKES